MRRSMLIGLALLALVVQGAVAQVYPPNPHPTPHPRDASNPFPTVYTHPSGPYQWGSSSSLLTGLVSAWVLQDTSDSHGSNDLTNNNGVTFVAPGGTPPANMPATVANFVGASSQTLSSPNVGFSSTTSFAFSVWYKQPSTVQPYLFGRMDAAAGNSDYGLFLDGNGSRWWVGDSGGPGANFVTFTNGADDTWHLLVVSWDSTDSKARVSLDGAAETVSSALPAWTTASGGSILFALGGPGAYPGQFYNGQESSVYVWGGRRLTSTEIACLYNAGAGAFYPFTGVC